MRLRIPIVTKALGRLRGFSSRRYWTRRYLAGGNSGPGSYNHLATFKSTVINQFIQDQGVTSVIEFGCGDGNQLALASYPDYVGYDISKHAIKLCRKRFADDATKRFYELREHESGRADLALSLDVIFHLTEDDVFDEYMRRLFNAAERFVVIYASNQLEQIQPVASHVRHRRFTDWIASHEASSWILIERIPNKYPYDGNSETTSFCDFFIYRRIAG